MCRILTKYSYLQPTDLVYNINVSIIKRCNMQFKAEKLKRILKEKRWTLRDLEKYTGKSKSYWSQVTSGIKKNLQPETVEVLCKALHINEDYFYLEDSKLVQDVIPDLPQDIIDFIMNNENIAWLRMNVNAKKNGLSPDTINKIINAIKQEKDSN
jgi:transcriptional regulator with XRE-family HTH domain